MTDMKDKTRAPRGASDVAEAPPVSSAEKERVAKVMARAGLCSRRDAEAWIKAGRVAVNGSPITSPALNVGPDDTIAVDGQTIDARERTRLFLYHKPRGLVTTAKDPEARSTVFDNLPKGLPRVVSVGRLDINTEGLLLLTNDGGLARVLELPATGWLRRYRVRANGFITEDKLHALQDGVTIDGVDYAGIEAQLDRQQGANMWLSMGLREGKNREIKRVLEHLGLVVNRLIRLSFGPFQLGELAEGEVEEVRTRVLKDQLGPALASQAGVEWEDAITAEVVTREVQQRERGEWTAPQTRGERAGRAGSRPEAPPPRLDRPKPAARPHVSALRAERPEMTGDGPRKRISRGKTEDRKGRTVAVERVTVEHKERHYGEGGTTRNARNFARDRRAAFEVDPAAKPARRARGEGGVIRQERAAPGETPIRREPRANGERPARARGPGGRSPSSRDDRLGPGERAAGSNRPRESEQPARDSKPARGRESREARGGFGSDRPQTGRALKQGRSRQPARSAPEAGTRPPRSPGGRPPRSGPAPGGGRPKGAGPKRGGNRPRSRG